MTKALLLLADPMWLIINVILVVYIFNLRRRIAGLNDPRLYLSKGERRAWARKELAEREEDRQLAQFQKNQDIVLGITTHKESQ